MVDERLCGTHEAMMVRAACILTLLGLASCRKDPVRELDTSAPSPASTGFPVAVASNAAPPEASVKEEPVATIGIVSYDKGKLDECAELRFFVADKDAIDKLAKTYEESMKKDKKEVSVFHKPCREALADRDELASCTMTMKAPPKGEAGVATSARVEGRSGYYNLSVLESSDSYMKDCLDLGGVWNALPADSPIVKRARAKDVLQKANKAMAGAGD